MLKIKRIKRKKNLYEVKLFDEREIILLEGVVSEFNLYINKELSEEELKEIKKYNQLEDYFLATIKQIEKGVRSKQKLSDFLKSKGASKIQIENIILKLQKYGYFDEEKLISEIVELSENKKLGINKIKNTLRAKGINEEKINKIKLVQKNEFIKAQWQCEMYLKKNKNVCYNLLKKKLYFFLLQKGFDEYISQEIVEKFCIYNKKHERNMLKLDYDKCFSSYSRKYKGIELNQKVVNHLLSKGYQIDDINFIKEKIK